MNGNTHSNDSNRSATIIPSPFLSDTAPPGPAIAPPRSMAPDYISRTDIPLSFQSSSPLSHLSNDSSPDHLFLSTMATYRHSIPPSQQLQQQQYHHPPQYILPSHSLPLEYPACPSRVTTAESFNQALPTHLDAHTIKTTSMAQDFLMSSALDVEEIPQRWLWDTFQQTAMDSLQLDRISYPIQEQQHQQQSSQVDMASHLTFQSYLLHQPTHALASSSGIHVDSPVWHPNALEPASRTAVQSSTPLVLYGSSALASSVTTISGASSLDPTMGSNVSVPLANYLSQPRPTATSGVLRQSRSDGVGRKGRKSSSKTSGSLIPSGRSGRSRSLVSSPRSPFLSDPNEIFGLDLPRTTPSYPLYTLQPHGTFHHSIIHSGHGNGYFSPSLSCSATSSSSSPSMSPQLSPHSSYTHLSSLTPTVIPTKPDAPIEASVSPAPTFVRLPPPMFQCPMEKCPKSFARAYNLHIHLKTQHHLASKELAAVSPLRAPPSAPPVQIITPEEVAAGTAGSDKRTPLASRSGSRVAVTTTPPDQTHAPLTSASKSNHNDNCGDNNDDSGSNGASGCCGGDFGDGNDDVSMECDSSCLSPGIGGSAVAGQGRTFACHLCSRIFSRKHDLHRHIRVHTGSKPYLCTNCNKAFARTDALCRHYKVEDDCRQVSMEVEAVSTFGAGDDEMAPHS